jgi:hypothetical protein
MSEYTQQGEAHTSQRHSSSRTTVWSGWIWFAAIVMVLTGVFNAVEGLVALLNRAFYATNGDQLIVFDLTAWGWVHLLLGALVGLAGLALLSGATWARIVGVAVATLNAMAQVAFIPAYPVWSTIVITLSILVIWALVVHGREVPGDLP